MKCYIYGSCHVKPPPLERINSVVDQVDYVLLEGVEFRKKGFLIFLTFPLWMAVYFYLILILRFSCRFYPRMKGKSDMWILKEFFEEKGKPVERVDYEFYDLLKQKFGVAVLLSLLFYIIIYIFSILFSTFNFLLNLFLFLFIFFMLSITFLFVFVILTMKNRDKILVNRIVELRNQGYRCLFIARGKLHLSFIKEEICRLGITFTEL